MKKILFFSLILIASCKPVKTTNSGETMLVSYKINETKCDVSTILCQFKPLVAVNNTDESNLPLFPQS